MLLMTTKEWCDKYEIDYYTHKADHWDAYRIDCPGVQESEVAWFNGYDHRWCCRYLKTAKRKYIKNPNIIGDFIWIIGYKGLTV